MLTLDTARTLLSLYRQMHDAAEAGDWEALADLERQASTLRALAESPVEAAAPSEEDTAELQRLIADILELDRQIRLHAEPALESTRKLISSSVKGRALRDAYGG
ncbi:flagellar protein FliT [Thauera sp. AutoDN2]|uniref:flagellar protein FliT n=1 Tax=Thauera sp. AutoDN2 TaxID=3416051 RepID=UPI003F4B8E4C